MYISGLINNVSSRLHQLPTGTGDMAFFETEINSYSGIASGMPNFRIQLDREYNQWWYKFTNSGYFLTGRNFWTGA